MEKYYLNELECFHVTRNVNFFPYIHITMVLKWFQHKLYYFKKTQNFGKLWTRYVKFLLKKQVK
jgi:hypothetical protein